MPPVLEKEKKKTVDYYGYYGKPCEMITSPRDLVYRKKRKYPTDSWTAAGLDWVLIISPVMSR